MSVFSSFLIVTNGGDEDVSEVIVINKIIIYFFI